MTGLFKQVVSVLVSRGVLKASNLIVFLVMARVLGPEALGVFGVFASAVLVAAAAGNLGLRQSSAYELGQRQHPVQLIFESMLLAWPFATLLATGGVLLMIASGLPGMVTTYLVPALLATAGVVLIALCQGTFLGQGRIRDFNVSEVLPRLILLAGTLLFWANGTVSVEILIWIFSIGYLLTALLGTWQATRNGSFANGAIVGPGKRQAPISRLACLRKLMSRGWPYALTLGLIMLNTRVSVFMIAHHESTANAAYFFLGLRVNEIFLETATALGLVLFSHSVRSADHGDAMRRISELTRWLVFVMTGTVLVTIVLTPLLVPLLFGAEFDASVEVIRILALGLPFAAFNRVVYQGIAGFGRPLVGAAIHAPAVIINVAISYFAVSRYGAAGGATVLVLVQCGISVMLLRYVTSHHGVTVRDMLLVTRQDVLGLLSQVSARARQAARTRRS